MPEMGEIEKSDLDESAASERACPKTRRRFFPFIKVGFKAEKMRFCFIRVSAIEPLVNIKLDLKRREEKECETRRV